MTGPEQLQLVRDILTTVVTLSLPFIAYWIRRLEKNTNSIKDALVEVTGREKKAEGVLEGVQQEKDRVKHQQKS